MGKMTSYPPDTSPTTDDIVLGVDMTSGSNRKWTLANLISLFMNGPTITVPQVITPPANIARLTGEMTPYAGKTAPSGWLNCNGSAVSRATYADLFAVIVPLIGTCTITNASPAVVTLNSHGLATGDAIYLTTTGALPTGLTANTLYYVVNLGVNTFGLATSRANAYAGTRINTSSAGSGTHSLRFCPYGLGDGSTTFNVPDAQGRAIAGSDYGGGTSAAGRLALGRPTGTYGNVGAAGGAESHTLTALEQADMDLYNDSGASRMRHQTGGALGGWVYNPAGANNGSNSMYADGGGQAHNNVQPTLVANMIIKT